jgi:hypothetical protein
MDFGAATQLLASAARPDTNSARHAGQPSSSRAVAGPAAGTWDISKFISREVFEKAPQEAFRFLGEFAPPEPKRSAISTATLPTVQSDRTSMTDGFDTISAANYFSWYYGHPPPRNFDFAIPLFPHGTRPPPQTIRIILDGNQQREQMAPVASTWNPEDTRDKPPLSKLSTDSGRPETEPDSEPPPLVPVLRSFRRQKHTPACEVCMKVFDCASKVIKCVSQID